MRFRLADSDIHWTGSDDDTPAGHVIALGKDSFGNVWLWLFEGDKPSDAGFVGSIEISAHLGAGSSIYDRAGAWAGLAADDTKSTLAKLVDRAARERAEAADKPATGVCPVCRRDGLRLRKNGTVWNHGSNGHVRMNCSGAGKRPAGA